MAAPTIQKIWPVEYIRSCTNDEFPTDTIKRIVNEHALGISVQLQELYQIMIHNAVATTTASSSASVAPSSTSVIPLVPIDKMVILSVAANFDGSTHVVNLSHLQVDSKYRPMPDFVKGEWEFCLGLTYQPLNNQPARNCIIRYRQTTILPDLSNSNVAYKVIATIQAPIP